MLLVALSATGQQGSVTQITGMVRDSLSREGVSFATVSLVGTTEGVIANDKGGFNINTRSRVSQLKVSAMGFKTKVVDIEPGRSSVTLIDLVPTGVELGEVVVRKGKEKYSKKNNPAVDMIKRLRAQRDDNDPMRMPNYSYTQYERMSMGFGNVDDLMKLPDDRKWIVEYSDTSLLTGKRVMPVSVKETVARDYFQGNEHKQVILGTKHGGLDERVDQENIKKILDGFMGEINVFQNDIALVTNRFVSPLSRIAVDFYKFYLNDTVMIGGERCAVLSFVPFTPQTFGFLGRMYVSIEDTTLFIKRISMGVPYDINLNYVEGMSIVQDFERAPDGSRLKVLDNVELSMRIHSQLPVIFARRETNYRDHSFDAPGDDIFSTVAEQTIKENAASMSDDFWQSYRSDSVGTTSAAMNDLMQRLRKSKLFYWTEKVILALIDGYIPTSKNSKFDLGPINSFVSGNSLEGLRLRMGGVTTVNLNRHWFVGGYLAYGFLDEKFKYNGTLEYSFIPKKKLDQEFPIHSLRLSHQYDVDKLSQHFLYTNQDNVLLAVTRHKDVRMQYLRSTRLEYRREWHNHFSISLGMEHNVHEATRFVSYVYGDSTALQNYKQAGFTVQLRYAPGEKYYQARTHRIPIRMDAPIITLTQTYMPKGFMGSLYELNKTELGLQKRFWFSAFGNADVIIKGQKIWSKVCYPDLLLPNVNLSYTIQPENYSLMKPLEFINDETLSWDVTYWGNGVLMNRLPLIKRLRLREVVSIRGMWGTLSDRNNPAKSNGIFMFPSDALCQPMGHKPYMEAGVGIDNILTLLRVDYVWRLTYRDNAGSDRWGVRFQFHFNF